MDLFEYQGKQWLAAYGIPVPKGVVAASAEEIPESPGGAVVKAQVLTGGRGKAGGIAVCGDDAAVKAAAARILGMNIGGFETKKLLIEEKVSVAQELYLSILINRRDKVPSILFSDKGGMDIESVSKEHMQMVNVNPLIGLQNYSIKTLLQPFDLAQKDGLADIVSKAYRLFCEKKLMLLEINPLVITTEGTILALDSKITMDDWAIDPSVERPEQGDGSMTPFETYMQEHKASAAEMDGDILVYANGAGISMATADCILKRGGALRAIVDEASFNPTLTTPGHREYAAEVLKSLPALKPKAILMNMHYQAGLLDMAAMTYKEAFRDLCRDVPIVIRFKGRNADKAIDILKDTGMHVTGSFSEACDLAVSKAKG